MKTSTKILIGIGVFVLICAISLISTYNELVGNSENVDNKYAIIETDIQRRADLIPNLVNTVKVYASHEENIFTDIADARSELLGAKSPEDLANANQKTTSLLGRLLAITEAYPELKANENFINLQDELAGTENRIAVSRKDYNDSVKEYNSKIKKFPTIMFASMFGFDEAEYFVASEDSKDVPDVNFE